MRTTIAPEVASVALPVDKDTRPLEPVLAVLLPKVTPPAALVATTDRPRTETLAPEAVDAPAEMDTLPALPFELTPVPIWTLPDVEDDVPETIEIEPLAVP